MNFKTYLRRQKKNIKREGIFKKYVNDMHLLFYFTFFLSFSSRFSNSLHVLLVFYSFDAEKMKLINAELLTKKTKHKKATSLLVLMGIKIDEIIVAKIND